MNTHHITIRIGSAALTAGAMLSHHRSGRDGPPSRARPSHGRRVQHRVGLRAWTRQVTAIDLAQRSVAARDAWDGETVRSLVADDAAIDDFAVAAVDDYLANVEFEQITGWRFMQSECSATLVGPPTGVTSTYTMENASSRALGVGPFVGSSFEFMIADGRIQQVVNDLDFSQYSTQVFDVFVGWFLDVYPATSALCLPARTNLSAALHRKRSRSGSNTSRVGLVRLDR